MSPENRDRLLKAAPRLCRKWPPYCGESAGNGWANLIIKLATDIEELTKDLPLESVPTIAQIKEKFGGLRFYIDGSKPELSEATYKLIGDAERASYVTCEECGAPAETDRSRGWIRTLCEPCKKIREEQLKEDWKVAAERAVARQAAEEAAKQE